MGADISLPLFSRSMSNADFDRLLDAVDGRFPRLSADVHTWRTLRHIHVGGATTNDHANALAWAISETPLEGDLEDIAARLDWLRHDLVIAPRSICQPLLNANARALDEAINREIIVTRPGLEWASLRYLLGVLLGELHRLEGLSSSSAAHIDAAGVLRLPHSSLSIDAVSRTVNSIVWSDAGRTFSSWSQWLTNEIDEFTRLQELLAAAANA